MYSLHVYLTQYKVVAPDRQTNTYTQDNYSNPRACVPRVNHLECAHIQTQVTDLEKSVSNAESTILEGWAFVDNVLDVDWSTLVISSDIT